MKLSKKIFLGMVLLFGILSLSLISATYMRSNLQGFQSTNAEEANCEEGQDFIIQIAPFGCTPAVVRSDLLEESDVPIMCQLAATKINPLVDVEAIETISFTGNYPKEISGIGFHPAKAALGIQGGKLNTAILENIGYVIINLKKQSNAKEIPNSVSGTLTAKIKYDLKNAFGIGRALFSIPELTDEDWAANKYQYSFWNGKGTLKVNNVDEDSAKISVYSNNNLVSSVNLQKGESSNNIYIPGFKCDAGLKIKLEDLENPDTKVRLRVNAEVVEVAKGEKFLDNKCRVMNLKNKGLAQQVTIRCQEDEQTTTFDLIINPTILLTINGEEKEVQLGQKLYNKGNDGIYLGYIGTKGDSRTNKDLFIWLVSRPREFGEDRLSEEELTSITSMIGDLEMTGLYRSSGIIQDINAALKSFAGTSNRVLRFFGRGETLYKINFEDKEQEYKGNKITIIEFAGAQNLDIREETKINYDNAMADFDSLISSYYSESYSSRSTFGEEALYQKILLAWDANQKQTATELCAKFENDYPNSEKYFGSTCKNDYQMSNKEAENKYVTVNSQTKQISFDGIYEPSFKEFGVKLIARTPTGVKPFYLRKNEINYLDETGEDYVQLLELDENTAVIRTSISVAGIMETITKEFNSDRIKLEKDVTKTLGESYSFTLEEIHLKKLAKISVIPNIDEAGTQANFSFKIGIEKRAIELPPDKIKSMIASLNEEITKWEEISTSLGKAVEGLKTGCLIAGAAMVVKNFAANVGGTGIARKTVMKGAGGWTEKCAGLVAEGKYTSQEQCYVENADAIDDDVKKLSTTISEQNTQIKKLEEGITTSEFLSDNIVDTDAFAGRYAPQVSSSIGENLPGTFDDPSGKGDSINIGEIQTILSVDYSERKYSIEQLRNIELYTNVLNNKDSSASLKEMAKKNLYSELLDVKTNSDSYAEKVTLANNLKISPNEIGFLDGKDVKKIEYNGLTLGKIGKNINNYGSDTPVYLAPSYDGNTYLFILDDSIGTKKLSIKRENNLPQIYYYNSGKLVDNPPRELTNVYFEKYDSSSYSNPYKNAKLSYYETDPYKGLPAVVPFDLDNGWYAATKQTLAVGSNIQSYEASGRVSSFYVCNVGQNGLEEFQTIGDDICQMINTGTGQAYNQFPGLNANEATKIIGKAVQAIEQASKAYQSGLSGKVKILGEAVEVGTPAVNVPEYECQDFMSPKDCLLMFNLCDPVICPSSRCDLGGAYPVSDVIQSGIIGSIVLCLPNIQEKIIMPVCLTGIKAGIDSFLSVKKSYRDCLNESLTTGKMVGICDEIYSIYICDFFWRQALPLADMIIPKVVEALLGQNTRGGGEYLGVSNAWDTAKGSVDYFTQSYGANSFAAFKARSKEDIGSEICKSYASAVYPSGGDLLSKLVQADSPVQFTARFDEIPMSSATNPPTSHYKVFYHIYAGKDAGTYYQVYLKGSLDSSYYQDTTQSITVASGYISVGGYASETKDFIATSGHDELCVNINGEEKCGFKEVSTSFAINYVKDKYLQSQASQTDITKESECISGSASGYSLLNVNLQSATEEMIDPAIYNRGIIRICATDNPGKGTDPYAGLENSKWQEVGYCDNEKVKCWLDTESVKDVIKTTTVEGDTLDSVSKNYVDILKEEGGYLSESDFASAIKEIEEEENPANRIVLVEKIIDKVFWSNEKALLIFLRANAYAEMFRHISPLVKPTSETTETEITLKEGTVIKTSVTEESLTEIELSSSGYTIWKVAQKLAEQGWDETRKADECKAKIEKMENRVIKDCSIDKNCNACMRDNVCARFVVRVLAYAGIRTQEMKDYGVIDENDKYTGHWSGLESIDILIKMFTGANGFVEVTDFKNLRVGDIIILGHHATDPTQHIMIFDGYYDTGRNYINAYGEPGMDGGPATLQKRNPITSTEGYYVYKVFRYTGELVEETLSSTETIPISSTDTSEKITTIAEKIHQAASDIVTGKAYGGSYGALQFVTASMTTAGVTGMDSLSLNGLESKLSSNSNFVAISTSKVDNLQKGDIIFFGNKCNVGYSVGIFSFNTGNTMVCYTNLDSTGVINKQISFTTDMSKNLYLVRVYRYVGDLSTSEYGVLDTRARWTADTALTEVNKRAGKYSENKIFVNQLILDGLLNENECNQVSGRIFGFGQKDMTWVKAALLQKRTEE